MPRRLIMWNVMTLDGFFEGPTKWDLSFHQSVWGDELEQFSIEQLHGADALLFGRTTYEGMASYWTAETGTVADLMNAIPKYVASRTLTSAGWNNSRLLNGDAVAEVARLKAEPGKDIFVFGSAALSAALMQHGLFDEYRLCVAPVVLGRGTPLFASPAEPLRMQLLDTRPLASGGVILRYQPAGA